MLLDRQNFWKLHGAWFVATGGAALAAVAWCLWLAARSGRWPGGGSAAGLTLGTLAAAIFLFEMALVAKKSRFLRTARWSLPAQVWMQAHLWLGLLTVPLVLLHSGAQGGGWLTTWLLVNFGVVIASGLVGLALQNWLPRLLLEAVPAETIHSQIDRIGQQYAAEARRLIEQPEQLDLNFALADKEAAALAHRDEARGPRIRGAERRVGPPRRISAPSGGGHAAHETPSAIAEALRSAIEPYLQAGAAPPGTLGSRQRNQWYFDDLRLRVPPESRPLVGKLEDLCERRRQLNVERRLHGLLHGWLAVHLPLSVALLALLAGHIFLALRFD